MDFKHRSWYVRYFSVYAVIILLLISFVGGFLLGEKKGSPGIFAGNEEGQVENFEDEDVPDYLREDVDFNLFWDVWNTVRRDYIDQDIPPTKMFYGALSGIVASLQDPHSIYFDPETTEEFTQELFSSSFEGIGAEVGIKNDRLTIIAPLPGTPAYNSGLKAGDKVFAIDGLDTTGMALDYAVSLIRGEKGTAVVLTVRGEAEEDFRDVEITRDTINVETVKWEMKETDDKKIAYIEISHFNSDTESRFDEAVKWVLNENPDGVILDLRNNPGGFLDTGVKVASEWIERGDAVVYEEFGDDKEDVYRSRSRSRLRDYETVVLVNKGSASASEIVAGALQDYDEATIVGEVTFGKGSVQELKELKDGSSVKLTVAKWFTPDKRAIDQVGIEPDIKVELTKEDFSNDRDPQLDKALEILGE